MPSLPFGAGSQFDFLSVPGLSRWKEMSSEGFTTIFQLKTFTAMRFLQQTFHFLRSRDQIVSFGDLLRE
jgi:hypothetical protein